MAMLADIADAVIGVNTHKRCATTPSTTWQQEMLRWSPSGLAGPILSTPRPGPYTKAWGSCRYTLPSTSGSCKAPHPRARAAVASA
jgi:hypothetical protein